MHRSSFAFVLSSFLAFGCGGGLAPEPGEHLPGGDTTNKFVLGELAFAQPVTNLDPTRSDSFFTGNALFNQIWVIAPASVTSRDGLGPTFNSPSCSGCHFHDGRGRPPIGAETVMTSMLVRLSIPGTDAHGGPLDEPAYGGQFQPLAIDNIPGEGDVALTYVEIPGMYADGTPYSLRQPTVVFSNLNFGAMMPGTMTSARTAPSMIGLGLLELIDESTLLALEDPNDVDGDGISGHVNHVWDAAANAVAIGRFGWKAGQPDLRAQSAGAFLGDMGLTTAEHPTENCPPGQTLCAAAPTGGAPEVDPSLMDRVALYSRTLAPPIRAGYRDHQVLQGREVFRDMGCPSCHVERFTTGNSANLPELSGQDIRPFTDLLLHDMGPGLADNRPEFEATGTEWRTSPLWGLGRQQEVNGHMFLLHDGRARGVAEAILWHDGEAFAAREEFRSLSLGDRLAVIAYLESL